MASTLPTVPRIVFTILEPCVLFGASVSVIFNPQQYAAQQVPVDYNEAMTAGSFIVTRQLASVFFHLAMLHVAVLSTSNDPRVIWRYLATFWIGDLCHVLNTWHGLGTEQLLDISRWNSMMWGNAVFTVFFWLVRTIHLLGGFGPNRVVHATKRGID